MIWVDLIGDAAVVTNLALLCWIWFGLRRKWLSMIKETEAEWKELISLQKAYRGMIGAEEYRMIKKELPEQGPVIP